MLNVFQQPKDWGFYLDGWQWTTPHDNELLLHMTLINSFLCRRQKQPSTIRQKHSVCAMWPTTLASNWVPDTHSITTWQRRNAPFGKGNLLLYYWTRWKSAGNTNNHPLDGPPSLRLTARWHLNCGSSNKKVLKTLENFTYLPADFGILSLLSWAIYQESFQIMTILKRWAKGNHVRRRVNYVGFICWGSLSYE